MPPLAEIDRAVEIVRLWLDDENPWLIVCLAALVGVRAFPRYAASTIAAWEQLFDTAARVWSRMTDRPQGINGLAFEDRRQPRSDRRSGQDRRQRDVAVLVERRVAERRVGERRSDRAIIVSPSSC